MWAFQRGREEVCPFCFEPFELADTPFRCSSPMAHCAPQIDPVLQKQWGDNRPMGKVLPAATNRTRSIRCPDCGKETTKRLCPNCHSELPQTTGTHRNYIFAIIGAKEAGKSHYIAVLIDQIKKRVERSLGAVLMELSGATIERYTRDFFNPVFHERRIILATGSGLSSADVRQPLIYSLAFSQRSFRGLRRISKSVVLVFFDTAGEDLNADDVISTVNKYIYRSNGIILLIDPLQLPRVRQRLGASVALPGVNAESSDILTRTTRLIQNARECSEGPIPIPMAVAFSKSDAIQSLIHAQFQLNAVARHDNGFDVHDFEAVNGEMRKLLDEWGSAHLVNQVDHYYPTAGFFGLSALGCNPHGTGQIPQVVPKRVEDPFLWLLYVNKIIGPVKKR